MIAFSSEKVQGEWTKAPVALRLVVEAMAMLHAPAVVKVFRVQANTKFEKGVHATGIAADLEFDGCSEERMAGLCRRLNERFFPKGPGVQVATLKTNLANFPSGRRADRPHVHIQIPLDWKCDPRRFLRDHGFTGGASS